MPSSRTLFFDLTGLILEILLPSDIFSWFGLYSWATCWMSDFMRQSVTNLFSRTIRTEKTIALYFQMAQCPLFHPANLGVTSAPSCRKRMNFLRTWAVSRCQGLKLHRLPRFWNFFAVRMANVRIPIFYWKPHHILPSLKETHSNIDPFLDDCSKRLQTRPLVQAVVLCNGSLNKAMVIHIEGLRMGLALTNPFDRSAVIIVNQTHNENQPLLLNLVFDHISLRPKQPKQWCLHADLGRFQFPKSVSDKLHLSRWHPSIKDFGTSLRSQATFVGADWKLKKYLQLHGNMHRQCKTFWFNKHIPLVSWLGHAKAGNNTCKHVLKKRVTSNF